MDSKELAPREIFFGEKKRTVLSAFRLSEAEYKELKRRAKSASLGVSAYIRKALVALDGELQ